MLLLFTDEQIRSSTSLTLTAAMLATYVRDPRLNALAGAACGAVFDDGPTPVGATTHRSWQLMLRASLAPDGVPQMLRDATQAWELEGESPWKISPARCSRWPAISAVNTNERSACCRR